MVGAYVPARACACVWHVRMCRTGRLSYQPVQLGWQQRREGKGGTLAMRSKTTAPVCAHAWCVHTLRMREDDGHTAARYCCQVSAESCTALILQLQLLHFLGATCSAAGAAPAACIAPGAGAGGALPLPCLQGMLACHIAGPRTAPMGPVAALPASAGPAAGARSGGGGTGTPACACALRRRPLRPPRGEPSRPPPAPGAAPAARGC